MGADGTTGTAWLVVVTTDVVEAKEVVLPDGVGGAGGVVIGMSFFSTFPLFSSACKGSLM